MEDKEIILNEISILLREEGNCKTLGELADLMDKCAESIMAKLKLTNEPREVKR